MGLALGEPGVDGSNADVRDDGSVEMDVGALDDC